MKNETYRITKLDDTDELPYEFIFKTDALKLMDHLNKSLNEVDCAWYVRSVNRE